MARGSRGWGRLRMSTDKFIFYEYRNILAHGDNADTELRIYGNVAELKKLLKIIGQAIEYAEEDGRDGFDEDDIDSKHVSVTAYFDSIRIKEPKADFNPFETF